MTTPPLTCQSVSKKELLFNAWVFVQPPHKADLKTPELTILVQVVKDFCAIGIVSQYRELAKYNLRELCSPVSETETPKQAETENAKPKDTESTEAKPGSKSPAEKGEKSEDAGGSKTSGAQIWKCRLRGMSRTERRVAYKGYSLTHCSARYINLQSFRQTLAWAHESFLWEVIIETRRFKHYLKNETANCIDFLLTVCKIFNRISGEMLMCQAWALKCQICLDTNEPSTKVA